MPSPQVPTDASIGYGAMVEVETLTSPGEYVEIGEVRNITAPSATLDLIDATHMQSPDGRREFVPGLIDGGECSFEMNYIPGSVTDQLLLGILALAPADRARSVRLTYPNTVTDVFIGVLQTYEVTVPTGELMAANVSFKVSGAVTRTVPSPLP